MKPRSLVSSAKVATIVGLMGLFGSTLRAQANPGDPLFCDPNEGTTFLIVNGGSGVFTVNSDCYGNVPAADTQLVIPTGQGGTLTKGPGTSLNYTYTPPTPNFTGLDTFSILVTTVCNRAGGPGSSGNIGVGQCPGGPVTLSMTLNVLPATMTIAAGNPGVGIPIPVPTTPVSGCPTNVAGQSGTGPSPSEIVGCTTGVIQGSSSQPGFKAPTQGTLSTSGNTLLYTPNKTSIGTDTFTIQVQGVNTDGLTSLNSGLITVTVTGLSQAPIPSSFILVLVGLAVTVLVSRRRSILRRFGRTA